MMGTANTQVPLKVITSVKYGTEDITVTLEFEWVSSTNTSYTVSVETPYILESSNSLSSARLIGLSYNTHLNVSIMARWCGIYTATTIIELHYGKLSLIYNCATRAQSCIKINFIIESFNNLYLQQNVTIRCSMTPRVYK